MRIVFAALVPLLLSMPAAADTPSRSHEFFWTACALGVTEACAILVTDALAGNAEAQFRLGVLLAIGGGTEQDRKDAAVLILAAFAQGHAGARRVIEGVVRTPRPKVRPPPQRKAPAPPEWREPGPVFQKPKYQIAQSG